MRHVFEPRHVVLGKLRVQHPAVFETHFFAERSAQAHDDAAFHLRGEVRRILNGAALERFNDVKHFERAGAVVHFDSRGAGDVGPLLSSARQADSGLLCRGVHFPRALPAELVCGGDEHGAQAIVGEMAKPKFQRIDAGSRRQFVHERFAREGIGRGRQRAIRPAAQGLIAGFEFGRGIRDRIRRRNGRSAGVEVDMFPGDQRAILIHGAGHIDHSCRTEVGPGKLVFAAPAHRNRLLRGQRKAGGFDRDFARMLAAKTAAGVRHNHPHVIVRQPKRSRKFFAGARGLLCAGPNGEFAILPFGHRGPRFHGSMLNVCDLIRFAQRLVGALERFVGRAFDIAARSLRGNM